MTSITKGDRVVRVSLRSDEGKLEEKGTVEKVFTDSAVGTFGYNVVWDDRPKAAQYVAPVRIVALEHWQQDQIERRQ